MEAGRNRRSGKPISCLAPVKGSPLIEWLTARGFHDGQEKSKKLSPTKGRMYDCNRFGCFDVERCQHP